jgi:hypothetical protein
MKIPYLVYSGFHALKGILFWNFEEERIVILYYSSPKKRVQIQSQNSRRDKPI